MNDKIKVARLSVASNTLLTLGKLAVGLSMNSVSIISEAIHSGLDLVAALIACVAVHKSSKPADEYHQYGHGKVENISSIVEAFLIIGAGVMIIANALPKIRGGGEIHDLGLGAAVMAVSVVLNFFVSRKLMQTAKKTDSPALAADAWHLLTDVYTSLGVFIGMGAIYVTGLTIIDPLIAIGVAMLIFKAAYDLIKDSMCSILDVRLPKAEEQVIHSVLKQFSGEFVEYHELRTRKSGSERHIDLHLVVPRESTVREVHELCDRIEEGLRKQLPGVHPLVHAEPCGGNCENVTRLDEMKKLPSEQCPVCRNKVETKRLPKNC